jgi:uncharacterized protein (TIGR02217 family)
MAFDESVFPLEAQKLKTAPGWNTTIIKTGGGSEQRNGNFSDPLRRYDAAMGVKTLADYRLLEKHFNGRKGRLRGFPLLDRVNSTALTEPLGVAGGIGSTMQLTINQGDAANAYNREIYKPKSGTILIYANTVLQTETTHYTINYATGVLTWVADRTGQSITWSGTYYVPVRYDVDELPDVELFLYRENATGLVTVSVPMVETRDIS